jgi:putative transposase
MLKFRKGRSRAKFHGDDIEVRRISQQSSLKWNGERTFVGEIFVSEWVGLRALDERYFQVLYGPLTVGFLDTFR